MGGKGDHRPQRKERRMKTKKIQTKKNECRLKEEGKVKMRDKRAVRRRKDWRRRKCRTQNEGKEKRGCERNDTAAHERNMRAKEAVGRREPS